jgi:hypothetical protein
MHSACALHHGLKIVKLRLVGPLERNDAHGAEPGRRGRAGCAAGRAVVGGLSAATIATLFVLPSVFAVVQGRSHRRAASLDPNDPQSSHYQSADATS